jgi:acylpyruvate hydrolase
MRLATIRTAAGTAAVRLQPDGAVHLGAADVGALLADGSWAERAVSAAGETFALDGLDYAPLVPHPEKIICVGLNYRNHILEMLHELPGHPTLFAKYPPTLIGAYDDIVLPAASDAVDWEAELAIVIGARVRHADDETAAAAIAGWTVLNDVSARDWQNRTSQFLPGKCCSSARSSWSDTSPRSSRWPRATSSPRGLRAASATPASRPSTFATVRW